MSTPRALILSGDGINCERETAHAFECAGFEVRIAHLNDLIRAHWSAEELKSQAAAIALPGGFSFGDDLGSGHVLALKIRHALKWDLADYARRGGLVIGICNGFQALIKLGVFGAQVSITDNAQGAFVDRWVEVETPPPGRETSDCVWTRGLVSLRLPIRHGEGRVMFAHSEEKPSFGIALRYIDNPNGSTDRIAGLCDESGRILGLMPHPEAAIRWSARPDWTQSKDETRHAWNAPDLGLTLFTNAYQEATR